MRSQFLSTLDRCRYRLQDAEMRAVISIANASKEFKASDKTKFTRVASCLMGVAVVGAMTLSNVAFAADGKELFKYVIQVLGVFACVGGAYYGFQGFTAYAEAKSEGEGPAMAKAKNQLYSAALLVILGVSATTMAEKLAGFIIDMPK